MTTEDKDAEIDRLRKRIADLEHDSNLTRVEEVQGVYREAKLESEIERLKGELAESVLLMEQGRECLRQLVALANVNADTRKMLRYLGNTFNLFLQKHTPPLNCGSSAAGESPDGDTLNKLAFEALDVWNRQRGRVFESMGTDNPRACAIDEAMTAMERHLKRENPSHSGGGNVCTLCGGSGIQELPLGCMGTEVCVLCLGTGKSALRELPPTGGVS